MTRVFEPFPNFGQQRSSRARQAISTSFLPAAVPAPPSLRVLQIHPDVTSVRGNMFHPPTSGPPPPTTAACLRFGLPRCKEQKERPEHDGGKISRACIAGIGGLNWARVVPLPVIFPPATAPEHQHQHLSTNTRAPAPTPRGNKHGHCAVVTPSPSSHLRYQRAMVQHPPDAP